MPNYSVKIPHDSNLRYLPLVYLIPEELLVRCPTLMKIPRNPHTVFKSSELLELIDSDAFLKEIMDAVSELCFPHFGFPGWKEHYSGFFPGWMLSYAMPLWAKAVEAENGWGLQRLFQLPKNAEIIVLPKEQIDRLFEKVVKRVIEEQDWQPMLDVLREMPCDEDFELFQTRARIDFLRKWYHTRSTRAQSVSLEDFRERFRESPDDDERLFFFPDPKQHVEEYSVARADVERFLQSLPEKERRIVELREAGYTLEEIAEQLGYANHSSVLKRMEGIKKKYREYIEA